MSEAPFPNKYESTQREPELAEKWENLKIYRWDPNRSRQETFVVDTPPPTVSGSLHIGHVFSYSQTDVVVRFKRMTGKNIFYPIGWDDNGLPTERRVQNIYGVKCDSNIPYNPHFKPNSQKEKDAPVELISRKNFYELCDQQTVEDEKNYERLWRRLGLSYDWTQQYSTVGTHCRKISQASFLDLVKKNQVYSIVSPNMWDTSFKTAVAQAEVEDRPRQGFFYDIQFKVEGGGDFVIATTRPELLAACVAVVAHPDDQRYQKYFGKFAISPLFEAKIPIMPAEHANPEKGTGILMVCTFGDVHDVEFWKKKNLPLRQVIGREGQLLEIDFNKAPFQSQNPDKANEYAKALTGLFVKQAKTKVVEWLKQNGYLIGEPKPTEQAVKFYEKGDHPLEFVPTRQWYVKLLEHKEKLLTQGKKVKWHPEHMRSRFEQWVEGLNQDWCISRQRYFGVPFPVWYTVGKNGEVDYDRPIYASANQLPVDPMIDCPPGFNPDSRNKAGGFIGDPDVMDTWATSSLTPQISSHWQVDPSRHQKLFPADLRPQAHEIIRTWAFYTITKSWMHEDQIPWYNAAISGWVVDPEKKKMSKSKGNVVTPDQLIEQYGADAIRYWATRAKLGTDTLFDESIFKIGQRLVTKIFNASKFVLMQLEGKTAGVDASMIVHPLDQSFVLKLNQLVDQATQSFERFDYASVLMSTEAAFWDFCDNYLELVKTRAYQERELPSGKSAQHALEYGLKTFLRLFAPFLPFITDETWSWYFSSESKSVHTAKWPSVNEAKIQTEESLEGLLDFASQILMSIRTEKTKGQKSMKWPVSKLEVTADQKSLEKFKLFASDLIRTGSVANTYLILGEFNVIVELGDSL